MNSWDYLRDLLSIQERVNRLFEDALGSGGSARDAASAGTWSPAVDICETETEFLVNAEVPDVLRGDIDIRITGSTVTIEGERRMHGTVMEGYHRIERAYGRFQRSFPLPGLVDQDKVTATLKDGILEIVLPKRDDASRRQIEVAGTGT